jgi:hypothetical protein
MQSVEERNAKQKKMFPHLVLLAHGAVVSSSSSSPPRRRCGARSSRNDKPLLEIRKRRNRRRCCLVVVRGHGLAQTFDGLCPTHGGVDVGERLSHAGLGRIELAHFAGDALGQRGSGRDALSEVLGVGAEGGDRLREKGFLVF